LRLYPIYPLNLLIKISSKIYKPNILYFKYDDKNIEDFINSICGDFELNHIHSKDSNAFSNECKPFLYECKITYDINNFTFTNYKEYYLNENNL